MTKPQDNNKELAKEFLHIYLVCMDFNSIRYKNAKDRVECDEYYKKFEFHANKYIDSKKKKEK